VEEPPSESVSDPVEPSTESLQLIRSKSKRCSLAFISKILVTGKFAASFDVIEETTTDSTALYKAIHVIEAKTYTVRKIIFELENGAI
jgi:hypothetical protein